MLDGTGWSTTDPCRFALWAAGFVRALSSGMPVIEATTIIQAPRARVFDLARSIDAHVDSTTGTGERAIAGVTTGLIGLNEEVTWEARHLGVRQKLTSCITTFDRPNQFTDCMVRGAFKRMQHLHEFFDHEQGTLMKDRLEFEAPFGIFGAAFAKLYLTDYLRRFLLERNAILKRTAESKDWLIYLSSE